MSQLETITDSFEGRCVINNEDEILQDLLETNIRQRGNNGGSDKKISLRIKELERIYGIEHGGDRKSSDNNYNLKDESEPTNQTELADSYGISHQTMNNYIRMAKMIPELEELVDIGIV